LLFQKDGLAYAEELDTTASEIKAYLARVEQQLRLMDEVKGALESVEGSISSAFGVLAEEQQKDMSQVSSKIFTKNFESHSNFQSNSNQRFVNENILRPFCQIRNKNPKYCTVPSKFKNLANRHVLNIN
jgi:hypothetical protein